MRTALKSSSGISYVLSYDCHIGKVRTDNQDHVEFFQIPTEKGVWFLLVLCDGMGGHNGGEQASKLGCQVTGETFTQLIKQNIDPRNALSLALSEANRVIYTEGQKNIALQGMGTTIAAMIIHNDQGWIGHVGDSRIYRIRNNEIQRLTKDHSTVMRMVESGLLQEAEANNHPDANILSRCLGGKSTVESDISGPLFIYPHDRFLLCSDGLHGFIDDRTIASTVLNNPVDIAVQKLIALANDKGGYDNISVQLIHRTEDNHNEALTNISPHSIRCIGYFGVIEEAPQTEDITQTKPYTFAQPSNTEIPITPSNPLNNKNSHIQQESQISEKSSQESTKKKSKITSHTSLKNQNAHIKKHTTAKKQTNFFLNLIWTFIIIIAILMLIVPKSIFIDYYNKFINHYRVNHTEENNKEYNNNLIENQTENEINNNILPTEPPQEQNNHSMQP